jgi:phosphoglycerate kinase
MQVVAPELIRDKTVLLRLDLDVPIENGKVADDFRLIAGMETLGFCLDYAKSVIIMGHLGRPEGKEDPQFSVQPIVQWLEEGYGHIQLPHGKLHILENLRFEPGEDACDEAFAKELASFGDIFINDSFAAYHKSASTTVLPKLLPHAAGLRFAKEVEMLSATRNNPERPLVAILGGAKLEDKLPVVETMSHIADLVLVGGKLAHEIKESNTQVGSNVLVADLNEDGEDITQGTIDAWQGHINGAKEVLWNGPLGKVEDPKNDATIKIAQIIASSGAKSIIGGGDTVSALDKHDLLDKFTFVSTGGGAMLKFLVDGTLVTIEALG